MELTDLVGRLLPALDRAFPTDLVSIVDAFLTDHAGAESVELSLADYDMELLTTVRGDEPSISSDVEPVTGSDRGQAFTTQAMVVVPRAGGTDAYVPVSLRAERLGVLVVRLPGDVPPATLEGLRQVATTVAYVIFAGSRFTDMYEQARRRKVLALDAEMQWTLLPVRAFATSQFEIAGQLMPAYDVGGDSFDYSVESTALHVSVTDAMGHGLRASMLDALAVAALRNARRANASVAEQAQLAHDAVFGQFGGGQYLTGWIARVHLGSGLVTVVNGGHPPAYRLRAGRVEPLALRPQLPLGLFPDTRYGSEDFQLDPGDRLFLVSDGVTEAGRSGGAEFGEERLAGLLLATRNQPPHEAVRSVLRTVSDYQQGSFRDDATALCLDWYGPS